MYIKQKKKKDSVLDLIHENNKIVNELSNKKIYALPVKAVKMNSLPPLRAIENINNMILNPKHTGNDSFEVPMNKKLLPMNLIKDNNKKINQQIDFERRKYDAPVSSLKKPIDTIKNIKNTAEYINSKPRASVISAGSAKDNSEKFALNDSKFSKYAEKATQLNQLNKNADNKFVYKSFNKWLTGSETEQEKIENSLTNDEKKIAAYYYEKGGKKAAQQYINQFKADIDERTRQRELKIADELSERSKNNKIFNILAPIKQGANTGLKNIHQFAKRMTGDTEILPQNPLELSADKRRENLSGVGKVYNDIAYSAGNMIPAIIASAVATPAIGAAVTGAGSAGGAYADNKRDGKSDQDAFNYSLVNGIIEGGLQYALGGIESISKGGASKLLKKIPGIKSASGKIGSVSNRLIKNETVKKALNITGKHLVNMGDEAFEEYLQANIDPVVRNVMLDENNEIKPFSEDKLYAAALGGITAGILNSPDIVSDFKNNVKNSSNIADLINNPRKTDTEDIRNEDNLNSGSKPGGLSSDKSVSDMDITPTVDEKFPNSNVQDDPKPIPFNNNISQSNNIVNNSIRPGGEDIASAQENIKQNVNNKNYLINYTKKQAQNIIKNSTKFENHVNGYDTTLPEFFEKYKNGADKNKTQKLYLGKANDGVLNKMSEVLGYEVKDRNFIITDNDVRHIYSHHGNEKNEANRGQISIDENIINNIPEIINNPDEIFKTVKREQTGINFAKQFPDGKNVYIQFDNTGRGTLQGKTFYVIDNMKNDKKIKGVTPGVDAKFPNHDVRNDPEPTLFNNNISQDDNIVNNSIRPGGGNIINGGDTLSDGQSVIKPPVINKDGTNYKLYQNSDKISALDVAFNLKGDEFDIADKDYKNEVIKYYGSIGGKVHRDDIGDDYLQGVTIRKTPEQNRYYVHEVMEQPILKQQKKNISNQDLNTPSSSKLRHVLRNEDISFNNNISQDDNIVNNSIRPGGGNITNSEDIDIHKKLSEAYGKKQELLSRKEKTYSRLNADDIRQFNYVDTGKWDITDVDNDESRSKIKDALNAKIEYDKNNEFIENYKNNKRSERDALAAEAAEKIDYLDGVRDRKGNLINDKIGLKYDIEKADRILEEISKNDGMFLRENFYSTINEANRMIKQFTDKHVSTARKLNISTKENIEVPIKVYEKSDIDGREHLVDYNEKVSEDFLVHHLGETESAIKLLKEKQILAKKDKNVKFSDKHNDVLNDLTEYRDNITSKLSDAQKNKIYGAIDVFQNIYDEIFDLANKTRIMNGDDPIPYRRGYYPHFKADIDAGSSFAQKMLSKIGIKINADLLPTEIAGLTQNFKPNSKYNPHLKARKGNVTTYSALRGLDNYLSYMGNTIYQTENIKNLRALERAVRYKYSDDGIRQQILDIKNDSRFTYGEQAEKIDKILREGNTKYSNFATWLNKYANGLAGKKAITDRELENMAGRKYYSAMSSLERKYAVNTVCANISSAIKNFIPLTQLSAVCDQKSILLSLKDSVKASFKPDSFSMASQFIYNRSAADTAFKTKTDKVIDATSKPFEFVDTLTSNIVTRSLYNRNIKNGMDAKTALHEADIEAGKMIGDRNLGNMPVIFNSKNPLIKMATMFQYEVNNMYSFISKDIPNAKKSGKIKSLTWAFMKLFISSYLINDLFEDLTGSRATLDPINTVNELAGDLFGKQLPNTARAIKSMFTDDEVSFDTEKTTKTKAIENAAENIVKDLPFVGSLAGGGRYPVANAVPNPVKILKSIETMNGSESENKYKKAGREISKEILKPAAYILPPFGGAQARKTIDGLSTVIAGGSYSYDKDGNKILEWPVLAESTADKIGTGIKAGLFGKYSLREGHDYIGSNFKKYSSKKTDIYEKLGEKSNLTKKDIKKVVDNTDLTSNKNIYKSLLDTDLNPAEINELIPELELKSDKMYKHLFNNIKLSKEQIKSIINILDENKITASKKTDYILNTGDADYIKHYLKYYIVNKSRKSSSGNTRVITLPIKIKRVLPSAKSLINK